MKKFLLKILFAILPWAFLPLILFAVFGLNPFLSNNVSLDAKLGWLQVKKNKKVDLLLIGSSLTQSNLSSESIKENLNDSISFLNAGAWSLSVKDNYKLLPLLINKYQPKTILIASGIPDFELSNNVVFYSCDVSNFLNNIPYGWYNLKYFSIRQLCERKELIQNYSTDSTHLFSLTYDADGGISFKRKLFQGDSARFSRSFILPKDEAYPYFIKLCELLKKNNIRLIVAESPVRKDFCQTTGQVHSLNFHREKIKSVCNRFGFTHIDIADSLFADSLFIDQVHLNDIGARKFTTGLMKQITF